ncbi:MAG TPA: cytochrome P450 [Acidimicrobiales bacterium]|nr:cytochrome P450 [Acidimicrobiales bacterium]
MNERGDRHGGARAVDYDHHRPLAEWDPDARHAELRATCPVAYTERHGGYWVVTAYDAVATGGQDARSLTTDHDLDGTGSGRQFGGIAIPAPNYRSLPSEVDGPEHLHYRRLVQPALSPTAALEWGQRARRWTAECIAPHLADGRIDLVLDIANPVPAMVTLALVGLPAEEWETYAEPLHALVYAEPGSEARARIQETIAGLRSRLAELVAARRASPQHDVASSVVDALDDADAVNVLFTVISGGLDTTTALIANALVWLDEHRDVRDELARDPAARTPAREEFLRVFSPAPATARTVAEDVMLGGQELHRGERVLLSWAAANRDPSVFPDPDRVDVARPNNRHLAFGAGPHRCIGASLARTTFDAVLGTVLEQLPDYAVDRAAARRYDRVGAVNGWVSVPATFAPRPPA